jgi:glycine/D-amino acid oxidase-like deaminating enzyme
MDTKFGSVWLEGFDSNQYDTAIKNSEADVLIIGGGFTGLNAALTIAKNETSTILLEQYALGNGASSRNGGFATTGCAMSYPELVAKYGKELAKDFFNLSLNAIRLLKNVTTVENIDCDMVNNGNIVLASKESHFKQFRETARISQSELDHKLELLTATDTFAETGSSSFYGGLLDVESCSIHPVKYLSGLAEAAVKAGAKIYTYTHVKGVKKETNGWIVFTNKGILRAKEIIIATNGYSGDLKISDIQNRIMPRGSYLIATEKLTKKLKASINVNNRLLYTSGLLSNYFRITPDGRFLFGGRHNFTADVDLKLSRDILKEKMLSYFPMLENLKIEYSWSGKLGFTRDKMPHIGKHKDLYYCIGYSAKGIPFSTLLGVKVANILLGKENAGIFNNIRQRKYNIFSRNLFTLPFIYNQSRFKEYLS